MHTLQDDLIMLKMAFTIAEKSTCIRRDVGAVAVDVYGRFLAASRNGAPRGYPHCKDTPCSGATSGSGNNLDLCEAVHAEINLLAFCQDIMKIDTIYITASPCINCVKAIANSSCRRIVFGEIYPHPQSKDFWMKVPGRGWDYIPIE